MDRGPCRSLHLADHEDAKGDLNIDIGFSDEKMMFSATVLQAKYSNNQNSLLFESEDDFEKFMENGKSSYTPATTDGKYSRTICFSVHLLSIKTK